MVSSPVLDELEAALALLGKEELTLLSLLHDLPASIRERFKNGDDAGGEELERHLHAARKALPELRQRIGKVEGRIARLRRDSSDN